MSRAPARPARSCKAMGAHAARRDPRRPRSPATPSPGSSPGSARAAIVALRADDDARRGGRAPSHSPPPRSTRSCWYGRRARSRCSRRRSSRSRASGSPTTSERRAARRRQRRNRAARLTRRLPRDVRLGCRDVGVPDRRRRRSRRARRRRSGTRSARRRARCTAVRTVGSPPITGGAWPTTSRSWPTSVSTRIGSRSPGRAYSRTGRARRAQSGVDFYRALVDALLAAGIEPVGDALPLGPAASARGPRWLAVTRDRPALRRLRACRRRRARRPGRRVGRRSTNRGAPRCSATAPASTRPVASTPAAAIARRATTCCSRTDSRSMRCGPRSPAHPRSRSP